METRAARNSFDALCELASAERWCWRIFCSTCGHMHFRYGLHEILLSRHPDSTEWIVSQKHPVLNRGGEPKELGALPPVHGHWPIAEQHSLLQVLVCANLRNISRTCTYPDWLGYLGLALLYSEDAEQEMRAITKAWVPQLMKEREDDRPKQLLQSLLSHNSAVLTWQALESLE